MTDPKTHTLDVPGGLPITMSGATKRAPTRSC